MSDDPKLPTDRKSPVGAPVIRGNPAITGADQSEALDLDPDDPDSLELAAEMVAEFASADAGEADSLSMLRGAAACAVLVRGEESYRDAAQRAGEGVSISFVRTWARVHDLPRSVRRHVALGDIAPSTAKHIARLTGTARLYLAWAVIDHDLTVREVRDVVSGVRDGESVEAALAAQGYTLGKLTIELSPGEYCRMRREASLAGQTPGDVVTELFRES